MKNDLPIVVAQRHELLVVVDVEKPLSRTLFYLAGEIRHQVMAIEVDLVGCVPNRIALHQLFGDLGIASHRQDRW
jgi:hypothetical protein